MVVTSFASFLLLWATGYEPRHRCSKREIGIGRLARRPPKGPFGARVSRPAGPGWAAETPWMPSPPAEPSWMSSPRAEASWMPSWPAEPEFPGRLASDRLRRALEDCATDELTRIIPEIAQVIVHSSASTRATAWNDFREATGNNPQEDAVVIRLGRAHEPLWLITNAPLNHAMGSA